MLLKSTDPVAGGQHDEAQTIFSRSRRFKTTCGRSITKTTCNSKRSVHSTGWSEEGWTEKGWCEGWKRGGRRTVADDERVSASEKAGMKGTDRTCA
ncbi:hypothetical protein CDAR_486141 [Caerostris darwini]|uniref:Uncharacterized protein n=1 Tax=Caerostris darwini TaxID=1538125 RepID=A0AAV4M9V9_9ARAC|nr:hypothetical protein CDAR_486141 [Caerostris darwini]